MICGSELFRPTAPRDPPQEASASSRFFAERISTDCIISATSKILSRFASVPMAVISSPGTTVGCSSSGIPTAGVADRCQVINFL
jgi:hypothetical protein